jgi:hypothetical protein
LLREYRSFQAAFAHLDSMPVPALSAEQKAEIFRRSLPGQRQNRLPRRIGLGLFRRPAVTFAAGIVLGGTLMLAVTNVRAGLSQPGAVEQRASLGPPAAERVLTVAQTGRTQVYQGKIVERLYPQI